MPAPASTTYATATKVAAMTAVLGEVDGGTSAAQIRIYTEADVLLASVPLNDPGGTVDANGVLTLSISGPDPSANNTGTATWAAVVHDLATVVSFPVKSGTSAESGYLVLRTTDIILGQEVTVLSAVLG